MKASVYTKYGPPDVLTIRDIEKPVPKDHEVLIRVMAATVNRTDCAMLRAKPFIMRFFIGLWKPRKLVLGTDFAGVVEATGQHVKRFKVGDRVFGFNDMGVCSHAQYMTIAEQNAMGVIPDAISFRHAAASIEGAHYAYNFSNKVTIAKEQKILVNGATGAIGSAMVQLLKYYGAHVTAVCNKKNVSLVKSLGADRIIDFEKEDFTNGDQQYDCIFDAVGKSSFGRCKHLLTPRGIYSSSELGWMAQNIFFALITPVMGGKKVIFPIPTNPQKSVTLLQQLMEQGKFMPVIDRVYPLEQIATAFQYVETGQKTGNVIITLDV
ncbi:MAG: NAD(P)-dependent alcohol dehydrogenase [Cyclobacteriaceae bacterium]|nr:NAD(P)-dependent alcohol dehydrogenase [Cyclobacteriaceae bacterium]